MLLRRPQLSNWLSRNAAEGILLLHHKSHYLLRKAHRGTLSAREIQALVEGGIKLCSLIELTGRSTDAALSKILLALEERKILIREDLLGIAKYFNLPSVYGKQYWTLLKERR